MKLIIKYSLIIINNYNEKKMHIIFQPLIVICFMIITFCQIEIAINTHKITNNKIYNEDNKK